MSALKIRCKTTRNIPNADAMSRSLLQTPNAFTSAAVRIVAIFTLIVAKMSHILLIDWRLRPFCEGIVRLDGESAAEGLVCGIADAPKSWPRCPTQGRPGNSNSEALFDHGAFRRPS
jgi:hypothetical protein